MGYRAFVLATDAQKFGQFAEQYAHTGVEFQYVAQEEDLLGKRPIAIVLVGRYYLSSAYNSGLYLLLKAADVPIVLPDRFDPVLEMHGISAAEKSS